MFMFRFSSLETRLASLNVLKSLSVMGKVKLCTVTRSGVILGMQILRTVFELAGAFLATISLSSLFIKAFDEKKIPPSGKRLVA